MSAIVIRPFPMDALYKTTVSYQVVERTDGAAGQFGYFLYGNPRYRAVGECHILLLRIIWPGFRRLCGDSEAVSSEAPFQACLPGGDKQRREFGQRRWIVFSLGLGHVAHASRDKTNCPRYVE